MKSCHIIVKGKVQGVFYRKTTKEYADAHKILGTVMNLPDGSVEIFASGSDTQLDELTAWCHKGSPKSEVTTVDRDDIDPMIFEDFSIRYLD